MTPDEWNALTEGEKLRIRGGLSELGKAACDYADNGLAVFPLMPKSKVPAIDGGFLNAVASWEDAAFWWSMHPDHNIGIATGAKSRLLVVDVDADRDKNKYGDESLHDWESANCELPETATVQTPTGGQHLYFRSDGVPGTNNQTLCIDIKSNGGYVVAPPSVHPKGGKYFWDLDIEDYGIEPANDTVMELYRYVMGGDGCSNVAGGDAGNGRYVFPDRVNDGEGREQHLFTYACSLRSQGKDYDEILASLRVMNNERVNPPKHDYDLKRMAKSACKKPSGLSPEYQRAKERAEERRRLEQAAQSSMAASMHVEDIEPPDPANFCDKNGRNFKHALCGQDMIERYHVRFIDGVLCIWNGMFYESGDEKVEQAVCRYKFESTSRERSEVIKWLYLNAGKYGRCNTNLIAFKNCILDWRTGDTREPNYEDNITNVIPHEYNPSAKSDILVKFITDISCNDEGTMRNISEMMGLCLSRDTTFGRLFILVNRNGSNGKSTFLNFVQRLVGTENCSAVDMATMGEKFQTVPLIGKLANIGDDIPPKFVDGTAMSILKRTVLGDTVPYEIKGGKSGSFKPYCTVIYSMNKMPEIGDATGGVMRRLHPVEFAAHFDSDTPGFDPRISEKLDTEEAYEAAIMLALEGLRMVEANNGPTKTAYMVSQIETVKETNDPISVWLDEITIECIIGQSVSRSYQNYIEWRDENGWFDVKGFSKTKFQHEIIERTGLYVTDSVVEGQPKKDGRKKSFHRR